MRFAKKISGHIGLLKLPINFEFLTRLFDYHDASSAHDGLLWLCSVGWLKISKIGFFLGADLLWRIIAIRAPVGAQKHRCECNLSGNGGVLSRGRQPLCDPCGQPKQGWKVSHLSILKDGKPNLDFPYFNFLGGGRVKRKHPVFDHSKHPKHFLTPFLNCSCCYFLTDCHCNNQVYHRYLLPQQRLGYHGDHFHFIFVQLQCLKESACRQHCRLSGCSYFGQLWQIPRRAGLSKRVHPILDLATKTSQFSCRRMEAL